MRPVAEPTPRRSSDDGAIVAWVRQHQVGVWRFLRLLSCDAATADEIVQDALLVGLERGLHTCTDRTQAAAFLRTTARQLWWRRRRDRQRNDERLAAAATALWQRDHAHDDGEAWLSALDTCRATLPARSQQVLDRFYRDGASRAVIASELGVTEHAVRVLLQRVRAALRACIERRLRT
ncbi:MAG: sigma-70 family RNA polymerase sigma factor [Planctomycetes bacterium]|nr:sigma-70 family RNA polymerase sigma factor [Planctomycetota bacterium]